MKEYQIVCTDQVPQSAPLTHAHIVSVGIDTDDDGRANVQHSLQEVVNNIRGSLAQYYTVGSYTGKKIYVDTVPCSVCRHWIIKTYPDNTGDNNLDSLRRCSWQ